MASLSDIPFLSGYTQQNQINRDTSAANLQQATGQMGLLAQMQAQQELRRKQAMEEQGRQALSSLPTGATSEQVMQAMRPYASPEHVFQWTQAAELKKAQADQTKQIAMARLAQQTQRDMNEVIHRADKATSDQERFHWRQQMDVIKADATQQALQIAAGNYNYNTGNVVQPYSMQVPGLSGMQLPTMPPGQTPAPAQTAQPAAPAGADQIEMLHNAMSGTGAPTATPAANALGFQTPEAMVGQGAPQQAPIMRADMPTDAQAQARALQLAAQGKPVAIRGPAPDSVPPERQPTAYLNEPGPAVPPPVTNQGMDPRDFVAAKGGGMLSDLARATAPPAAAQPTASAATTPQAMPEFTGSPREIAHAKNQWLMQQAKTEAGLGNMRAGDQIVNAIVEGRMPLPTGFALKSPYWQDVMDRVAKVNPNFDATIYGARQAARRTFASGPEAKNVTALNTVIGHLGTLDEAAQRLENGDLRIANAVFNRLATEIGDPRVQTFDTAKQAVAEEAMRVFRGAVGASEIEARQWGERINSSGSPKQLRGVIAEMGKLFQSRIDALASQFERTTAPGGGNPASVDPKNKEKLQQLIQQGSPATQDFSRLWKK